VSRPLLLVILFSLASAEVVAENPGGWEYSVAPLYLWGKSVKGTTGLGPAQLESDLNFKDDILGNLDAAFSPRAGV